MKLKRTPKNGAGQPQNPGAMLAPPPAAPPHFVLPQLVLPQFVMPQVVLPPPDPAGRIDLPTLTGQMSATLSRLRAEYGMAYTSRTWVEVVLPQHALSALPNAELARDLLATAALDAGAIRADVSAIITSHSGAAIIATAAALRDALEAVLAECTSWTGGVSRPSDPTGWPPERL